MKNKISKSKITENLGLKFIALLVAFCIWFGVLMAEDYSITKEIKGIPVEQLNGSVIDSFGKVYDVIEGNTVDIIVKGPRTVVDKLDVEDFVATADLSHLSFTNSVQIKVQAKYGRIANEITITPFNDIMVLSIEEKMSKQLPIQIITMGEVAEGYALGNCLATPNMITIEGPKTVVENIKEIRVVVDVTGKSETFQEDLTPSCYDVYGQSMEAKKLELSADTVSATIPIYKTKEVPVIVRTAGTVAQDYVVTDVAYSPQTLLIAGEDEDLEKVSEILIGDISVSGRSEGFEANVILQNYLPDGIYPGENITQVAVNVSIEKYTNRTVVLKDTDIELKNTKQNLYYKVEVSTEGSMILRGLLNDVANITVEDLSAYIDCEDLTVGEHLISLNIPDGENYQIVKQAMVKVIVSPDRIEDAD